MVTSCSVRFKSLLFALFSALLVICPQSESQTTTTSLCPPECPDNCADQQRCCPVGYYWTDSDDADHDDISASTSPSFIETFHSTSFMETSTEATESVTSGWSCNLCRDAIDYCEDCKQNLSSGDVVCTRCEGGLIASPVGDSCNPMESLPFWVIPLIVVLAVVLSTAAVVVVCVVVRWRRASRPARPRPPLPRPDELDDPPTHSVRSKMRFSSKKRERYTLAPKKRPQQTPEQGASTVGVLRDVVPSVVYEKREDVVQNPSSSATSANVHKQHRRRRRDKGSAAATSPSGAVQTKQATSPDRNVSSKTSIRPDRPVSLLPPDHEEQEIYQNIENEDEIYANDIQLPPTVSSAVAMETADGIYSNQEDGEVQELYQNVNEVSQTDDRQQHRPPLSRDEDDQPIYQNVERKPTPAPKATRRF